MTDQKPSPSSPHTDLATALLDGFVQAGTPVVSPDGRLVAFVVTRVDHGKNTYIPQIWLGSTDGSIPPAPLTAGDPGESQPSWSPDGRHLAFVSGREGAQGAKKGERTLHVIPVTAPGETRTVAVRKDGLDDPTWSPDGRWIAFFSRVPDERYSAEDESWQSPRRIDTFFTRLNGEDFIFDRPRHLWVVAADGTGTPKDLTPGPHQVGEFCWGASSTELVVSSARHDDWDRDLSTDLFIVDLDGEVHSLTDRTGVHSHPSVSPDGQRVAFLGHDDASTYPQNVRVGVVDLATRVSTWISTGLDRTFETTVGNVAPVWESDSSILATAEDAGECHLYRLDATGTTPPIAVTTGARCVKAFDAAAGVIVAAVSHVTRPAEIHVWRGGSETVLTDVSRSYVTKVEPVGWERFSVPVATITAGVDPRIDAWIVRPKNFDPTKKYPVILNVHGGPHTQYGETYFDEFQAQAAAGFVVVA
ncbi:MAG: S9 family peptidase, partial [Ilumatobacteraceae bacterium]